MAFDVNVIDLSQASYCKRVVNLNRRRGAKDRATTHVVGVYKTKSPSLEPGSVDWHSYL